MSDVQKLLLAGVILVILALLPGLIGFWGLAHSMALMFLIGILGVWLEKRGVW